MRIRKYAVTVVVVLAMGSTPAFAMVLPAKIALLATAAGLTVEGLAQLNRQFEATVKHRTSEHLAQDKKEQVNVVRCQIGLILENPEASPTRVMAEAMPGLGFTREEMTTIDENMPSGYAPYFTVPPASAWSSGNQPGAASSSSPGVGLPSPTSSEPSGPTTSPKDLNKLR